MAAKNRNTDPSPRLNKVTRRLMNIQAQIQFLMRDAEVSPTQHRAMLAVLNRSDIALDRIISKEVDRACNRAEEVLPAHWTAKDMRWLREMHIKFTL